MRLFLVTMIVLNHWLIIEAKVHDDRWSSILRRVLDDKDYSDDDDDDDENSIDIPMNSIKEVPPPNGE